MGIFDVFKRRGPVQLKTPERPPDVTDVARECARRIVDHVRLLHPESADGATIAAQGRDGVMQVVQTDVARLSSGVLPACVVVDRLARTAFLATDVGHLLRALGQSTDGWFAVSVTASRAAVSLLGVVIVVDEQALLFGDGFTQYLQGVDAAIAARQAELQDAMSAIGPCSVDWDRDRAVVSLRPKQGDRTPTEIPAAILGSFSPQQQSWCWAWANRGIEPAHAEQVVALRDRATDLGGGRLLTVPGFDCSEPLAFAAAYLAASHLGDKPIFRWPQTAGAQLFFAMAPAGEWAGQPC